MGSRERRERRVADELTGGRLGRVVGELAAMKRRQAARPDPDLARAIAALEADAAAFLAAVRATPEFARLMREAAPPPRRRAPSRSGPAAAVLTPLGDARRPPGLFRPRPLPRSGPPRLADDGRVYLPIAPAREDEARALGAAVDRAGRAFARADDPVLDRFGDLLPFYARPVIEPLQGDLIPLTSFGASLANLLTRTSWDRLRLPVVERCGRLCQICGRPQPGGIECHEVWEYWHPRSAGVCGVQRLVALLALCSACHRMFHLGRAELTGDGAAALERLRLVNRWSRAEAAEWSRFADDQWQRRSRVPWLLDVSPVAAGTALAVRAGKEGWTADADGALSRRDARGWTAMTALLGAPFSLGRTAWSALDPAEALAACADPRG